MNKVIKDKTEENISLKNDILTFKPLLIFLLL